MRIFYEAGVRDYKGEYTPLFEAEDRNAVEIHLEKYSLLQPRNTELVILEKTYELISTIPHRYK